MFLQRGKLTTYLPSFVFNLQFLVTKKAFQNKFYNKEKGTYGPYGGNIFALKMGLPEDQKQRVIAALQSDIAANGGHLDTGIFGTQFFFEVLAENGMEELAYEVMNMKTEPSYGWWIEQGATTTWEEWNGSGSHNHPMFGGGIVWLYRKLAGMETDPSQPGYRNIIFRPEPVGDISFVKYSNETVYGSASVNWRRRDNTFKLDINVPVGSTATVYVPTSNAKSITEGGKEIKDNSEVSFQRFESGYAVYSVSSGKYSFDSQL